MNKKKTLSRYIEDNKAKITFGTIAVLVLIAVIAIAGYVIYKQQENRIRGELTRERMEEAWTDILEAAEELGDYPDEKTVRMRLKKVNNGMSAFDGWGNKIKYRIRPKHVEFRSFGPDGKRSDDDIVVSSRDRKASFGPRAKNSPEPKPNKDK